MTSWTAGALALLATGGLALAQEVEVGGRYTADGKNLDGSPYKGQAEISGKGNQTCRIAWRTGGSSVQRGICMRQGNILSAAYSFASGTVGLVIYEIQPDGSLNGIWTIADQNGAGAEILTPVK